MKTETKPPRKTLNIPREQRHRPILNQMSGPSGLTEKLDTATTRFSPPLLEATGYGARGDVVNLALDVLGTIADATGTVDPTVIKQAASKARAPSAPRADVHRMNRRKTT
jgi:hypothetical protein